MKTPKTMTVNLLAGKSKDVPVVGRFLHIRSCSVDSIQGAFDNDPFQVFYPGSVYPASESFEKIRFRDYLGAGCSLVIRVSQVELIPGTYDEIILEDILEDLRGDTTPEGFDRVAVGTSAVQVIAANANRKGCSVQAQWNNSGIVFIGFDNTVTATKYADNFAAGEGFSWDDYRGDVYAIGSAAGQYVGYGEW